MSEFVRFRCKGREYLHIEDGWCLREIEKHTPTIAAHSVVWRVFWGPVIRGGSRPQLLNAHVDEAGEFVQFPTLAAGVEWIRRRRNERS